MSRTRRHPLHALAWLLVLATGLTVGCSQSPKVESLPPQTVTSAPPQTPPSNEGFATPDRTTVEGSDTGQDRRPSRDDLTIYIDGSPQSDTASDPANVMDGRQGEEQGSDLLRASAAEKKRRETAPQAVLVINDENLAELAEGGRVTVGAAEAKVTSDDLASTGVTEEELYWRNGVRSLRQDWRQAHDSILELEEQAATLRTRFYAEDDPAHRDRIIKPEWDRTLDRLDQARRAVIRAQEDLDRFLEEGSRAGALPGWLREGMDLEPEPERGADGQLETVDPAEPREIEPPHGDRD